MQALLILALAAFLAGPALAFAEPTPGDNPAPAAGAATNTPDQAVQTQAGKFVQDLGDNAIAVISNKSIPQDQRTQKYQEILGSSFNMQAIGHFVVGRAWNNASEQERQDFMKLFEQLVIKTYGEKLNLYSGEGFKVVGTRPESDKDTIVNSQVTHADGSKPTKVDWRVRNENGKPAIIDVVVEGVSQSVTQRDEYGSIIQRDGGKLNGLMDLMRKQLQDQPQAQ